ncbi:MAG: hypothetical protein JWO12_3578 [Frankiales bacterium]|nr:hypothetical protein [Frankiales bacterium]
MRKRDVVDHALERRAVLAGLYAGRTSAYDVCDASPYLQSAAKRLGTMTTRTCPVCRKLPLAEVHWVYGAAIGDADGTARTLSGVTRMAAERPDFAVYQVEVCLGCGWNHLVSTWRAGTPGTEPARRTRRREA